MTTATAIVTYKGRKYRQLYRGKTKFGADKAKLQFMDGSKEFWVDGSAVGAASQSSSRGRARSRYDREDEECELCGKNKYTCGHCIGW